MSNDDVNAVSTLVALVLGITFGAVCGWALTDQSWERGAVEAGHAEWYVEDHKKEWRWKVTE